MRKKLVSLVDGCPSPTKETVQINPLLGKISQMTFSSEKYSLRLAAGLGKEKHELFSSSFSPFLSTYSLEKCTNHAPWPVLDVCSLEPHLPVGYPTK